VLIIDNGADLIQSKIAQMTWNLENLTFETFIIKLTAFAGMHSTIICSWLLVL